MPNVPDQRPGGANRVVSRQARTLVAVDRTTGIGEPREAGINCEQRRPPPFVFINYRDCDEPWAAKVLDCELSRHFGDAAVFLDSKSVIPGTSFDETLLAAIHRCAVLLVVIGGRWFAAGTDGRRLLDRRRDWVRREIATALAVGTTVIPVLVEGAPRLEVAGLPANIRRLARCQAIRMRHRDCAQDVGRLLDTLSRLLSGIRELPGSVSDRR